MHLKCLNCHYLFETGDYGACPRCSSKKLARASKPIAEEKEPQDTWSMQDTHDTQDALPRDTASPATPPRVVRSPIIMGDTKGAWQSFHSNRQLSCPKCGGKEFTTDFKHKEKTCKTCGELVSIRRHLT